MAVNKKEVTEDLSGVTQTINEMVEKGRKALSQFESYTQEQVDKICHAMVLAGLDHHMRLAKMAVEETGRGVYEDKIIKNIFATEYIWNSIKDNKTVGVVREDKQSGIIEIAEPVGVIAGVTPTTNPTSTTMFKSIISIKTRNPIIFAFHPSAQNCSLEAARILLEAAVSAGAPEDCIQWIKVPSIEATKQLMNHEGVSLVLATGGSGMVKSAYSTGKPALGVGPGNVPCYIEKTANIKQACNDLMLSKTFDNGMICASEQSIVVDEAIYDEVKQELLDNKCYFASPEEKKKLESLVINENTCAVNADIVGKSPYEIATKAGVDVPQDTKILIVECERVGEPLTREKLSPVLAAIKVKGKDEGIKTCDEILHFGGLGHSAVIHTGDEEIQKEFGLRMRAYRIIFNSPSTHGGIGDIYNAFIPSLTLGCGSYGKNSVSANVTSTHLLNFKKLGRRNTNMQWFKIPPKIYFEKYSTQYLEVMQGIKKAFIVTDAAMVKLGYVDVIKYHLEKQGENIQIEIFSDVEPDPSDLTVYKGAERMRSFEPDTIIAFGGGSAMDAAKGMWLFYEYPETDLEGPKLKFLDIRKRAYKYPHLGRKAKFVAIPTTSGTGSEVTPFTVITDKAKNVKYPLADYELTPDVAIIDPQFVATVPKSITADTGMDVLTHAIEAYVSVLANDYTDGLAMQAIKMVFTYLPRAYHDGSDLEAREKMHNASAIAGMAFANAFLGINHSLAHKIGAEFHIPHGRANTILMPHVIRYNSQKPTKFVSFPKYKFFIADQRYAEIARMLGLPASTTEEGVDNLIKAIVKLGKELGIEMSIRAQGVKEEEFLEKVSYLADKAFEDQCTTANPRLPLVKELEEVYLNAYRGF
ncbi:bifunctional acetaldehyde-CoA/alcohol dehydrogenase [Gottfriedia acidiceleris]|uniref:Aldehyde-alcohol dehydrogenase n=1 Tax=Gottfriedia acidiceleris TaxID=371036 RepID=A0ABY4JGK9_9BACI|nr:bifunctional acetaldehyde-CoA/alcohol dehydrogenase [Gottfriedia acidiceleris]UPM52964.1 bifunctional acetaldehyde-CoA/alcohol dehydrogenase [Gottfriedia acidiceleris]